MKQGLRGWANYHHHGVAKAIFSRLDSQVWVMLWKWARRRHPNKSVKWVKDRYFHQIDNCSWTFAEMKTKDGEPVILFKMASVPIVRHVKIRGAAHPFDPKWKKYLKNRKLNHARKKLPGATNVL